MRPYNPAATHDELKALLLTPTGNKLRVAAEHFLAKSARSTPIVCAQQEDGAPDLFLTWEYVDWLLGRAVNITELGPVHAKWMFKPAFLSQVLEDLLGAGGLQTMQGADESQLAAMVARAAKVFPRPKAKLSDIVILDNPGTNTWLDHMRTVSLVSPDGSARTYMQYRLVTGAWRTIAHANDVLHVINQLPYTFQSIVGDIQGLPAQSLAQMIGAAFLKTEISDGFDFIVPTSGLIVEVFRRGGPDPYGPIFAARWKTAYPAIAKLCQAEHESLCATAAEAREAVCAAAIVAGYGDKWSSTLVDSVETLVSSLVHTISGEQNLKDKTALDRLLAAARAAVKLRLAPSGGPQADGSQAVVFESSDEKWAEAAKNPSLRAMLAELTPLHTTPIDAEKCARVLMRYVEGLIFINGTRVPDVQLLKDMTAARNEAAIHMVVNSAVCIDRMGVAQPTWGAPVTLFVCQRHAKGKWIFFESLTESMVRTTKESIDLWHDVARHIVRKEDGPGAATTLSPERGGDALCVFMSSARLQRATPILKRFMACVGVEGTHPFSWPGLLENTLSRLQRIEALPESKGKRALMGAYRYAVALSMNEGQRFHMMSMASPVSSACRNADFFSKDGAAHGGFKTVDSLFDAQQKRALEDSFCPDEKPQKEPRADASWRNSAGREVTPRNMMGSCVHGGLLWRTNKGGFNYGGAISIERKDGQILNPPCAAALLLFIESFQRDPSKCDKWCSNVSKCSAMQQPLHAAVPSGIAVTDLDIKTDLGSTGARFQNTTHAIVMGQSRGRGKGGGQPGNGGKGQAGGRGKGAAGAQRGKGAKGGKAGGKAGGRGNGGNGRGRGRPNFGRQ